MTALIIIITCCVVIPLALLGIPLINSRRVKRKAWLEERNKIKAYGEEINEETRNKNK